MFPILAFGEPDHRINIRFLWLNTLGDVESGLSAELLPELLVGLVLVAAHAGAGPQQIIGFLFMNR